MILSCCGSYVKDAKQLQDIQVLTSRYGILWHERLVTELNITSSGILKYIMSFVAEKFHPSLALNLVTATLYDYIISRNEFVVALQKHLVGSDVGSHAHVNVFEMSGLRTFIWGADSSRPFGVQQETMCPNCGYIAPWQRRNDVDVDPKKIVYLKCRSCKKPGPMQDIPSGLTPIHSQAGQKWYFYYSNNRNGRLVFLPELTSHCVPLWLLFCMSSPCCMCHTFVFDGLHLPHAFHWTLMLNMCHIALQTWRLLIWV